MRRFTQPLLLSLLLLVCVPAATALAQDEPVPDAALEQEEDRECADAEADCEERDAEAEDVPADGEAPSGGGETRTSRGGHVDRTVPKVTRLRVRQVRGGKRVTFRLSEKADVTIVFEKCTVFRGLNCIHWQRTRTRLEQRGRKGANSALVGGRSLAKGKYQVQIHAVDGGHHHSNVAHTVFQVR